MYSIAENWLSIERNERVRERKAERKREREGERKI